MCVYCTKLEPISNHEAIDLRAQTTTTVLKKNCKTVVVAPTKRDLVFDLDILN
jgi:hypothetical protein